MIRLFYKNCYDCPFHKVYPGLYDGSMESYEVHYCIIPRGKHDGKLTEKNMKKRPSWCALYEGVCVE